MAAPPPTFSLAALFGAQPPDPHLSLYEAASRPYLIDAAPATPASVHAQLASAANLRQPTSILILDNTGKLRVISLLFQKQQGYGLPPEAAVDDKYYGWDSEFIWEMVPYYPLPSTRRLLMSSCQPWPVS
jgi:hypothetical protein